VRHTSAPRDGGVVSKHFPAARARDAHVESAVLRALHGTGLAPRLLAHDVEADGAVTLTLSRLPGRPFPRRATPALAAALGDALARLHARARAVPRRTTVDVLAGDAARHLRDALRHGGLGGATATDALPRESARGDSSRSTDAVRALADLLAAQSAGAAPLALCHADLKPEHLRVGRDAVALLDFERACLADPAWELACAMDRLALDAPARHALLAAYAARRFDPRLAVRVLAFRLAWLPLLPRAVAALEQETGRRPGRTARRLARAAAARWRALARALELWRTAREPG
jgi:aminoglycoside phosphotransferase (APT) family kinase protein